MTSVSHSLRGTGLLALAVLHASGARAGAVPAPTAVTTPGDHAFSNPVSEEASLQPPVLQGLDVHEHLGGELPLDLTFRDSAGKPLKLREALHPGRPAILTLVYYDCPMLCSLVMSGLVQGLSKLDGWRLGKEYDAITLSFNPADKIELAAEKRRGYLQALGATDASATWPFLTGDAASTKAVAESVGFDYRWDAQAKTFAHNAVIFVLTPDGKISRYLYGVSFDPLQLRLALTEAGEGKSGSSFERFLLSCYHYDPALRRYGSVIFGFLRTGGLLVFVALATLVGRLFWRETHAPRAASH